ncbi:MAG: response regulator [Chloroflexi bacterium]|nr:response regulator [Chloroflexota bacterium]
MGMPLRVLVVEDSEDDAALLLRELRRGGYDPTFERVDTAAAMSATLARRPWDLVLADYSLPQFSAPGALAVLRESGLDLPFIVVSGTIGEDRAVAVLKAGAHDFIMKDLLARLVPAIERELREAAERVARRQADAARRISEERFRRIAENAGCLIAVVDRAGHRLYNSPSCRTILGYAPEELMGTWAFTQIHPDDRRTVVEATEAVFRTGVGGGRALEYRVQHKDGSWRLLESSAGVIRNADGEVESLVVVGHDVTERKRAEAERLELLAREEAARAEAEAQRRFALLAGASQAFAEASPDLQAVLDAVTRLVTELADDACVLRLLSEDGQRLTPAAVAHPDAETLAEWRDLLAANPQRPDEGISGRVMQSGRPLLVPVVQPDQLRGVAKAEYWSFFERAGPSSIVIVPLRARGRAIGTLALWRLRQGQPFTIDDQAFLQELADRAALAIENARLYDQAQEAMVLLREARDELERRVAERTAELERANAALLLEMTGRERLEAQFRQAQKMEAVGRLAGGIAHDFNNLLTAINGFSELLLLRLNPADPRRECAQEIARAGERAATLTQQLLVFSRQQIVAPREIDLNAVIADIEKMLRRMIGEDVELVTVPAPAPARVRADPGQIEQVVMNLAVNARDAMPQGGRLTIEVGDVELDAAYARTHVDVRPGRYVVLAVSDTGCGMDAETQARIFEPFFTTKEHGKGTGLGLSTVFGIVQQSGGHIWVYSEPGQGATFKVYLPRLEEATTSTGPHQAPPGPEGGTETVLIVEDERIVRKMVRTILEENGYAVLEAAHGEAAIRVAAEHAGPIHLLITDVVMPGMSGRQVAERLAAGHPAMRVIYSSGYTDDAVVRHGVLEGGVAFLQKPFRPAALLQKVREVLVAPGE